MSTAAAGLLLGAWELEGEIGHGGQATVYRARHATLGRRAAVKLVRRAVWADPAFRLRFERECDALAALDHPNIIPVLDAGEADGRGYLVMRLARQGSLADRLNDGAVPADEALRLLEAVADALDAVHRAGHVHRDVTPANILLDAERGPWLGDFGLARRIDATAATRDGILVGTAGYLAPEVIAGGRAGPESDRYALAAVAYHVLTGRVPFDAPDVAGVLYGHLHRDPPPVAAVRPGSPSALDAAFASGLAKRPGRRPPTAGALIDSIAAALVSRGGATRILPVPAGMRPAPAADRVAPAPTAVVARRPRRRRGLRIAIIGVLAAAVGAGGVVAQSGVDLAPFAADGVTAPAAPTTVPGIDGIDVAAGVPAAGDLPGGVIVPGAIAATVEGARVVSLPGGAPALTDVRSALSDEGFRISTLEADGRPVGLTGRAFWSIFGQSDEWALLVVREPSGPRALVVSGSADEVRDYAAGLADSIGARILPTG